MAGTYILYADFSIQLNVKLNGELRIESVGLVNHNFYVQVDRENGIESFLVGKSGREERQILIDFSKNIIHYSSDNVVFRVLLSVGEIAVKFEQLNSFTSAYGIFGATVQSRNDMSLKGKIF